MKKMRVLVAASTLLAASFVLANVEVVDRTIEPRAESSDQYIDSPVVTTTSLDENRAQAQSSSPSSSTAEMFYQMQLMQQELLELRGLVEEQTHQIKRLKQQRLDDYVDLDRRLSALGGRQVNGAVDSTSPVDSSRVQAPSAVTNDEKADYQNAVDPIVGSTKNLDLAIERLHGHLQKFPSGRYAGNAKYWLGEAYLVKDKLSDSKTWFEGLLNDYPLHDKVPAAKLKLGIVYHKLGMNAQAQVLLQEVESAGGPAAARASTYLSDNF